MTGGLEGSADRADAAVHHVGGRDDVGAGVGVGQRLLVALRARGALRGRQLDRLFSRVEWRRTAQTLVRQGTLSAASVLPPASVGPKFIRTAQLAVPPGGAVAAAGDLGATTATQTRRRKALEYLLRRPEPVNVWCVYAESGCAFADLQELAERELIVLREQEVWRDPLRRPGCSREDQVATVKEHLREKLDHIEALQQFVMRLLLGRGSAGN